MTMRLLAQLNRRQAMVSGLALAAAPAVASLPFTVRAATGLEPVEGGTLRIGVQGDPTNLDPHLTVLAAAGVVVELVYEGLLAVDASLAPEPALAESWTVDDDGLTYTFALRDNATFHNGRAVVADDIVYSFNRVLDPEVGSPSASYASGIASMEAVDERTVSITLGSADASFLTKLCWWGMSIVPREEVEAHSDLSLTMVGTGPFAFDDYLPNTRLDLRRNPAYWESSLPLVDALEILVVADDTARTAALVSDTVDIIEQVPHRDIASLQADDAIALAGAAATNLRWLVFNLRREPLGTLEFRQAVAAAIDRQNIIDVAVFGHGEPLVGLYPPSYWAGYPDEAPGQDLDRASELLESVDLPGGVVARLLTWSEYDFLANTSIVVQEQLRQAGIETEIEALENATYIDRFFSGDFDIAVMGAAGYMDPNEWPEQSLATDGPNNAAGFSDPEFDALVAEGLLEQDFDARREIYLQLQQIVIDQAPWISLYTSSTYEGLQRRVQGFEHYISGGMRSVRSVWLDQT